jgi:hypothetical protein
MFDGIRAAPAITQPLLIVHSENAAIPHGAQRFYANLKGEKDALWLEGVTQFEFYHRQDAVIAASDATAEFFARH